MSENAVKSGAKKKKQLSPFQELFIKEIKPKVKPLEVQLKKMNILRANIKVLI